MNLFSYLKRTVLATACVGFAFVQAYAASGTCANNATYKYNFNSTTGVATFYASVNIGTRFQVPNCWKKINIEKNVVITGSFFIPSTNTHSEFNVVGHTTATNFALKEWTKITSQIKGTGGQCNPNRANYATDAQYQDALLKCRQESGIRYEGSGTLKVTSLKSRDPRKFHIWAKNKVIVNFCDIQSTGFTTDGVHGASNSNSEVLNTRIAVDDDALYVQEVSKVSNCVIYHRKNGSPFQVSWGSGFTSGTTCAISNTKVIADYNGTDYNSGVVSWQKKNDCTVFLRMKLQFTNFIYEVPSTKKRIPNFFQFGGFESTTVCDAGNAKKRVQNAQIEVTGLPSSVNSCTQKVLTYNLNSTSIQRPSVKVGTCTLTNTYKGCTKGQCSGSAIVGSNETDVLTGSAVDMKTTLLHISPNPGNGLMYIGGGEETPQRIDVFNLTGQRVLQTTNTREVNLTDMAPGVYVIRVDEKAPLRYLKQ